MTITVICEDCTEDEDELNDSIEMKLNGNLFFNPKTKTQSQRYHCPTCGHSILVVVRQ